MLQIKLEIPLRGYNLLPDLRLKNEKEALSCTTGMRIPYEVYIYFAFRWFPRSAWERVKEALSCITRKSVPYEADFYFASS